MKINSHFHQRITSLHRRTWVEVFVAWGLVAFYILASGRALVPGLCATQSAMDAQCHVADDTATLTSPTHGCCPAPETQGREDGEKTPVTPAESHCAFCNLLIAHTDPPLASAMPIVPEPVHADQVPLRFQVALEVPYAAAPGRAPPA